MSEPYWVPISGAPAYYGTTPPASPLDGDEWVFPADAAAGVMWRFRYRVAEPTYKWEFVGGAPQYSVIQTYESMTAVATWTDLATVGPQVTVSRAGDYEVSFSASCTKSATDTLVQIAVWNGVANVLATALGGSALANIWIPISAAAVVAGQAAATPLRLRYYQGVAGTMAAQQRALLVRPVRVS